MRVILQDIREKIKSALEDQKLYTAGVLILVGVASFGLGRQSVESGEEAAIVAPKEAIESQPVLEERVEGPLPSTLYVASKNSQVYHLPHCSGAKNISPANKITFASKEEAEAAGYRPAANCKGI
jgi:hypothetical protein